MKLIIEVRDTVNAKPELQEVWEVVKGTAKRTYGISENDLSDSFNLKLTPQDGKDFLAELCRKINRSTFVCARFET
jgi:hypothetical protein